MLIQGRLGRHSGEPEIGLSIAKRVCLSSPCRWQQGLPHIRLPGWLQNRGGEASASSQQASQQQQQRVAGKTCFPAKLCLPDGAGGTRCSQDLLTVGSRQWGHPAISSLLRVKIYDFALYMDGEQVCPLCPDLLLIPFDPFNNIFWQSPSANG